MLILSSPFLIKFTKFLSLCKIFKNRIAYMVVFVYYIDMQYKMVSVFVLQNDWALPKCNIILRRNKK